MEGPGLPRQDRGALACRRLHRPSPNDAGYLLNLFALARLRASTTAVYVYARALITDIAGVLLLGEVLNARIAFALLCLFIGV